jgi:hypothetical protein
VNADNEHRSRRESRRWPFAILGTLGGLMLGVLIVLAARGPSVIVINDDNCCCQCGQLCTPGKSSPGAATPRTSGRYVPELPAPEPVPAPQTSCCDRVPQDNERTARLIPLVPFWRGFDGGGGGSNKGGKQDTVDPVPVPEPGFAALLAAGLLAWRMS